MALRVKNCLFLFRAISVVAFACVTPNQGVAADIDPMSLTPLISSGHQPQEKDEAGLWQSVDELEAAVRESHLIIKDEPLNAYIETVVSRVLGEHASDVRVYIVRDPSFNATMAPNGMMIVHTGLLARMRNEAQLASVLGHEAGHYLRQHSLNRWRSRRGKTDVMAFVAVGAVVASGATGENWFDLANSINDALIYSIFSYDRAQESEADAFGLKLMWESKYSPSEAPAVWGQLIGEWKASADAREKRYRKRKKAATSTHPPAEERMDYLRNAADNLAKNGANNALIDNGRDRWIKAISPWRQEFLEEQVKLNDTGASLYLIESLAADGWDGVLRYFEGDAYRLRSEEDDQARAIKAYRDAIEYTDCPPEAFKFLGYALMKNGDADEGKLHLQRYLELKPDAEDAKMVQFSLDY